MILAIVLLLAAGFSFLMLTPLTIEVDTDKGLYRIRLKAIATATVVFFDGRLLVRLWIFGVRKTIDPLRRVTERAVREKTRDTNKRRRVEPSTIFRKSKAVLRSFRVSFFVLAIDTDDYVTNAWLQPIAFAVTKGNRVVRINYRGDCSLRFRIENRIGTLLFALTQ